MKSMAASGVVRPTLLGTVLLLAGTWEEGEEDPFLSWWKNRDDLITLAYAVAMGGLVATSVFIFDVSIQYVHDLPDILAQVRGNGLCWPVTVLVA